MNEYLFNSIVLVGRAGGDPELKYFDSGKAKANFSIAVNRYVSKDVQETDWFRIELWDKDAERAAEYIKAGMQVAIDGRLSLNKWTDASGNTQEMYSIIANSFRILSSKKDMANA